MWLPVKANQSQLCFLCIGSKQLENEVFRNYIATNNLGIHFIKIAKTFTMEVICKKRMKEDLNRVVYHSHGLEILIFVEMTVFPKVINIVPIKITVGTFVGIDQLILKFL